MANNTRPVLTLVTVVFRDPEGLANTIASVESQTYGNYEHVIIDGGGLEEDRRLLDEWQRTDPTRRRFLHEPDNGIYDAMNKGLKLAAGDLCLFLNAQDELAEVSTLQGIADVWLVQPFQWGFGRIDRRNGDRHVGFAGGEIFDRDRFLKGVSWVPHQATWAAPELLRSLGGFSEAFGVAGDQHLIMKLAEHSPPRQFPMVVSKFQNGGRHSLVSPTAREVLWFRMRCSVQSSMGWEAVARAFAYCTWASLVGELRKRFRTSRILRYLLRVDVPRTADERNQ